MVRQPEAAIDLAHAALLVAAEEEPRCDVSRWRAVLYELGLEARERVAARRDEPVAALNDYVFGELGFEGNRSEYYDVRNSLLNQVLERRTGIPITLSLVYMELGRRAGLHVEGVGMPGHFIVRVRQSAEAGRATLVDPFAGTPLDEDDCQQRLDQIYGGQVPLADEHLRALAPRQILVRLLRNLKAIYTQTHLYRNALSTVERILIIAPRAADELRDRAMLLAQLDRLDEAIADLQIYLERSPRAGDAEQMRETLKRLQIRRAMRN
ncbi:MAG TPA: transglutaminase-like domain-containing protein [Pyrinomonadaceae bacterium]|nr:transglutaminase-like domain-containing protein [Pyrinomonadaceae bacterium]